MLLEAEAGHRLKTPDTSQSSCSSQNLHQCHPTRTTEKLRKGDNQCCIINSTTAQVVLPLHNRRQPRITGVGTFSLYLSFRLSGFFSTMLKWLLLQNCSIGVKNSSKLWNTKSYLLTSSIFFNNKKAMTRHFILPK